VNLYGSTVYQRNAVIKTTTHNDTSSVAIQKILRSEQL